MNNEFSLGIDFGSNAVRLMMVNISNGEEVAQVAQLYTGGEDGVFYDPSDVNVARQSPGSYLEAMVAAMQLLKNQRELSDFNWYNIKGIGIDATGSTPIPVDEQNRPLASYEKFKDNLNAKAWMWKDHTSESEAAAITRLARKIRPDYLKFCGGTYFSEWFWAKMLHCAHVDSEVFDAAFTWVEFSDYIPAVLTGVNNARKIQRNICAAGHKGLYNESWGGYPDSEFLGQLHPGLAIVRETLPHRSNGVDQSAGDLCEEWARKLGLAAGIPVAMGALDAHVGAIGAGVNNHILVKIIGTSSCDIAVTDSHSLELPGISGIVKDSVIPGFTGIEGGQSAVGDIFRWFVVELLQRDERYHGELIEQGNELKPGQSGLMALDWNNGNRNVLFDTNLSGLILGQSLKTRDFEVYRALIEATAFGAKRIIDQLKSGNVSIERIICTGGIPHKNRLFMQVYADVLDVPVYMAQSSETVALGAAMIGAWVYLKKKDPGIEIFQLQEKFCKINEQVYHPVPENVQIYKQLYEIYLTLHDAFGTQGRGTHLFSVMKELLKIKRMKR